MPVECAEDPLQQQKLTNHLWLIFSVGLLLWFMSSLSFDSTPAPALTLLPPIELDEDQRRELETYLRSNPWDSDATNEASSPADKMLSDLRQLASGLKRCWSYAGEKKVNHKIDVDRIAEQLAGQVSNETTPDEFTRILMRFISELREGHAWVHPVKLLSYGYYNLPFGLKVVRDGVVAVSWPGYKTPVVEGSMILKIGERDFASILEERGQIVTCSTESARLPMTLVFPFRLDQPEVVVTLRDPAGELRTVTCQTILPSKEFFNKFSGAEEISWKVLDGRVGYLKVPTFQPDNKEWMKTAVEDRGTF